MIKSANQRLLDYIGGIDDFFLAEAEAADAEVMKAQRRKKVVKYSVAGVAGLAVSVGIAAVAYWKFGAGKTAKAA